MKKAMKIICVLLAAAVCLPLAGCMVEPAAPGAGSSKTTDAAGVSSDPSSTAEPATEPVGTDPDPVQPAEPVKITDEIKIGAFDDSLIAFIMKSDLGSENYMVSPLSLRVAVAMATVGAVGDTQKELLKALGFETADEMNEWAVGINGLVAAFEESAKKANDGHVRKFSVANSVWHNITGREPLLDSYIARAARYYSAAAENVAANEIIKKVNEWVNEKTEGMIPSLMRDDYPTDDLDTILTNALYLKDDWMLPFEKDATFTDVFTCLSGGETEKEYMTTDGNFLYFEDEQTQLVTLRMCCGVRVTFVLGDLEGIGEKLDKAKNEYVRVKIPKFETETSLDKNELIDFLKAEGVTLAFDGQTADFSEMAVEQVFIADIIQKTKIKVDENGLEAAAATAVAMNSDGEPVPPEKIFFANRPFSYFITLSGEVLFFGQIAE
ncbi:MAG: hypothetical protein IJU75_06865 [Clostridia bacterium]|nr:hypothetical protein [Clostridia bacterium]